MKKLSALARTAFREAATYRLDFWLSLVSGGISMYVAYSLWSLLSRQRPEAIGAAAGRMTTYGVLGMLLIWALDSAELPRWYIARQFRSGVLAMDLVRPMGFIAYVFQRAVADGLVQTLIRGLPSLAFAVLFLRFQPPPTAQAAAAFAVSLLLAFLVLFCTSFLMGTLAVVTADIRSYSWVFNALATLASGVLVPIWLFPPYLKTLVSLLPFQAGYYIPMAIYVDAYPEGTTRGLLVQLAWVVGGLLACRLAWTRVQRRLVIQGG